MLVAPIRNDVPQGFLYLNDVENRAQRNFPYETEGQSRYLDFATAAQITGFINHLRLNGGTSAAGVTTAAATIAAVISAPQATVFGTDFIGALVAPVNVSVAGLIAAEVAGSGSGIYAASGVAIRTLIFQCLSEQASRATMDALKLDLGTQYKPLTYRLVGTGPALLSFDRGVLFELQQATWSYRPAAGLVPVVGAAIDVVADDGSTQFVLP